MEVVMIEKHCGRCREVKPASEFNKDKHTKSGLRSQCKDCMCKEREEKKEYYRAWRQKLSVKSWYRQYRRETAPQEKKKRSARRKTAYAIERGSLQRMPCEVCGSEKVEAHHDDYSKPLEVRWLCGPCHHQWHAKHGEAANGRELNQRGMLA